MKKTIIITILATVLGTFIVLAVLGNITESTDPEPQLTPQQEQNMMEFRDAAEAETSVQTMSREYMKEGFIEGCNESGDMGGYCNCMFDEIYAEYGKDLFLGILNGDISYDRYIEIVEETSNQCVFGGSAQQV